MAVFAVKDLPSYYPIFDITERQKLEWFAILDILANMISVVHEEV